MGLGDHSDAQLIELARAGWAPAFAVLVHRYAPLVHAAVADAEDPHEAAARVFTRAMRELEGRDPRAPVGPWLVGLAGAGAVPDAPRPLADEELDALWLRLHRRWPTGRTPRPRVPWERLAAVAVLVVLAAVVPAVVLGTDRAASDEEPTEVRAVPLDEEGQGDDAQPDGTDEPADEEPDVTFGTDGEAGSDGAAQPGPADSPGTDTTAGQDGSSEGADEDPPADDGGSPTDEPSTSPSPDDAEDGAQEGPETDDSADGDDSDDDLLDGLFGDDEEAEDGAEQDGDPGTSDDSGSSGDSGSTDETGSSEDAGASDGDTAASDDAADGAGA